MKTFKEQSIALLEQQANNISYPGYPLANERLKGNADDPHVIAALGKVAGAAFAAPSKKLPLPTHQEQKAFTQIDPLGRPLHPWFNEMVSGPGAVLGNGFYWYWGENQAADGIPIRYDLDVPHILIGNRKDTGKPAFLAGMQEDGTALETAYREIHEEAFLDMHSIAHSVQQIYNGPLADIRATAHAWPVTTALMHIEEPVKTPLRWAGKADEMPEVYWHPINKLDEMHGSHRLIAQIALANLRS